MTPRERLLSLLLSESVLDVATDFHRVFGANAKSKLAATICADAPDSEIADLLASFEDEESLFAGDGGVN